MRTALLALLLVSLTASARPSEVKNEVEAMMAQVRAAIDELEYERAIPIALRLLKRPSLTTEQRVEACFLLASARAVAGDLTDAEAPFRELLGLQPDFDLGPQTPPKILAVFRKVQTEELKARQRRQRAERERMSARIRLLDRLPSTAAGGKPLGVAVRLRDPDSTVEAVHLPYRMQGCSDYSSLALARKPDGSWVGTIPAEVTSNTTGGLLEYLIEASDASGPLVTLGEAGAPLAVTLLPGQVQLAKAPPVHRAVFGLSTAVTLALGAGAATFAGLRSQALERLQVIDQGRAWLDARDEYNRYHTLMVGLLISAAAVAIVTAVLAPFTDFTS